MNSSKTSVSVLTTSALLIALGVVLSLFRIPLSTVTEITLTGLPIAAGGYLFGPWIGMLIGALIDICGFFVAPKGPFFPGFTISTALMGMVYGLLLYRKWWDNKTCRMSLFHAGAKGLALRVAFSHLLKTVFISLLLNCFWLSVFYSMTFKVVFLASMDVRAVYRNSEVILRFRDGGRPFNPEQYVRQFQSSSQDPSKNIGLRIVSGAASDMRYIPLVDHNIVLLRIPSEC